MRALISTPAARLTIINDAAKVLRPHERSDRIGIVDQPSETQSTAAEQTGRQSPSNVALVIHHDRDLAVELAETIEAWLFDRDHVLFVLHEDAGRLPNTAATLVDSFTDCELDVVIGIGGDGTMLRAAELVAESSTPIIGINAGQMGYLTEVEASDAIVSLERFFWGDVEIEDRMRVSATVEGRPDRMSASALNEVVIEKAEPGHTVRINANLNGEFFTSYLADGVIVSTPTGSTAYSLSARGPIVEPTHSALVLTPVAPHQLFDRTLVLSADACVEMIVAGHRVAHVVVDGRLLTTLEPGESLVCVRSARPSRFVRFGPNRFHAVLKRKFSLADR